MLPSCVKTVQEHNDQTMLPNFTSTALKKIKLMLGNTIKSVAQLSYSAVQVPKLHEDTKKKKKKNQALTDVRYFPLRT